MTQLPRFRAIDPEQLPDNPFRLIGKEWMLITAGTSEKLNMMTASWGGRHPVGTPGRVLLCVPTALYLPTDRAVERIR